MFIKKIFDIETRKRLDKVIANVKGYLSRNNEKIMRKISFKVHPYLFYKNKYKGRIYLPLFFNYLAYNL